MSERERAVDVGLFRFANTRSLALRPANFRQRSKSSRHPSEQSRGIPITFAPTPRGTSRIGEQIGTSTRTRSPGWTRLALTRKFVSVAPVVTRTHIELVR